MTEIVNVGNSREDEEKFTSVDQLVVKLNELYGTPSTWEYKYDQIVKLLQRVDFTTTETNKYTFFDFTKPYTRNLIATDGKNYTLLLLCWNPGKESKIHDHPCEGCFIKTIRGCIKETTYTTNPKTNEIKQKHIRFFSENQISYMHDSIGLHKIGNPSHDIGAVTLHLYTPPYGSCRVWSQAGAGELNKSEEAKVGFFSVYGHRTPHLEGRPGQLVKLLESIRQYKPNLKDNSKKVEQSTADRVKAEQ